MSAQLRFDPNCGVPAVRQIADNLRMMFVEGSLRPGTRLPSVRRLASDLGVHFNTVAEAYRLLGAEGWLQVSHGRRCVVAERTVAETADARRCEEFQVRLRSIVAEARGAGVPPTVLAEELRNLERGMS